MIVTKENIKEADFLKGCTLLVNKPLGYTSFQVVMNVRKWISKYINSKIKIGHAGTLDPLATGLLILCTGKDTKIINSYQAQMKFYSGSIFLGATRQSQDKETEVDQTFDISTISLDEIESVRKSFIGMQSMVPPIHSAIKVNGVRAYKMARKGEEVELKPKEIEIHEFEICSIDLPLIYFKISCSKGTYIRSVAHEFGLRLNSGAYLNTLQRDQIGDYKLSSAWQMVEFQEILSEMSTFPISNRY